MTASTPGKENLDPTEISQESLDTREDLDATKPPAPSAPGDEVPPGTPGSAEAICRACGGSGRNEADGKTCPECEGTGKVQVGVGGG